MAQLPDGGLLGPSAKSALLKLGAGNGANAVQEREGIDRLFVSPHLKMKVHTCSPSAVSHVAQNFTPLNVLTLLCGNAIQV